MTTLLPEACARREGNITRLALLLLGREAAIQFLNTQNDRLRGRPLALATESDAGEEVVRKELQRLQESSAVR